MPTIKSFGGIIPRLSWHSLPMENASIAHDVKIRNGKLEPWREKLAIAQAVEDAVCVHFHGCCPYTYDKCVDMTEYVVDFSRLYLTGRMDYPEVAVIERGCELSYSRLGVPAPAVAPTVTATEQYGRDCAERSYVYTYVNDLGEEGAPSPVSAPVTVADGSSVRVSGFKLPDAELNYNIEGVNIYRTSTVWRSGEEKTQEPGTEFLFVAFVPLVPYYDDTILEKELGEAITTEDNREPPANLRHITYLRGTGVLAGVTTNKVHFSKPYQPHNFPAELDLTLPYNIVNCVSLGSMLFVSTDSYPFVIKGAPSCEPHQCRDVTEVLTPLPDISCGRSNSAISTPFGMVYSSKDGLVLVSADAKFQLITSAWFSTDDWAKIRPDTVRLAYWRGYIICATDVLTFMLEIDGNTYNDAKASNLVTISDRPVCMTTTQSDELIMLQDSVLWQWNAGKSYRAYEWISRELHFKGESTPTTAKIRTDGITLKIVDSDGKYVYERYVANEDPVRLMRMGRRVNWRLSLSGKGTVEFATLGLTFNAYMEA